MSVRHRIAAAVLFSAASLAASGAFAATEFSGLDLSSDDRLLFSAATGGDGAPRQDALFLASLTDGSVAQLTAFPERMEVLDSGRTVQLRNPFGVLRVSASGGLPLPVAGFPSFVEGAAVRPGRTEDMAASPDGRWLLVVEPITAAYGRLVLIDAASGSRTTIAEGVERPGRTFPASWSPDSRVFVYARSRRLYFRPVGTDGTVEERYRLIGSGTMDSIRWGETSDFFYFRGASLYRVRSSELFARSLYADFLQIGTVVGSVPIQFDPNFDRFWVSPDASAMIVAKNGRNIFYYALVPGGVAEVAALPYLALDAEDSSLRVLWSAAGIATVVGDFRKDGQRRSRAFRLVPPAEDSGSGLESWRFEELTIPAVDFAVLSPDGTLVVLGGDGGIAVYDYVNWRPKKTLSKQAALSAQWIGNESLVVADSTSVKRVGLDGISSLICLSSVDRYGFASTGAGSKIVAVSGGITYETDGRSAWKVRDVFSFPDPATATKGYRVYLDQLQRGAYENAIMVRNLGGTGTAALLVRAPESFEAIPASSAQDAAVADAQVFAHGSRGGRRELSLVFDVVDEADGLASTLEVLKRYGIRATFFLNGEFIRRHPAEAKRIADAGMEAASMFFAPIDLTDSRYRIDGDFIRRGLARNEDEFYNATGRELSLLWHAPYYSVKTDQATAAATAGYRYVGRDVDPMDWVSAVDARRLPGIYKSAAELVDDVVARKRPGSIVPIRLGVATGGREDYLFDKIDVLVDALVRSGYSIVPVSTLMEHAR